MTEDRRPTSPRATSNGCSYDFTTFPEVVNSARDAYAQAGVTDPAAELAMAEVHDCFTPTEMILMEDLGFVERGHAWKEVLAGTFDRTVRTMTAGRSLGLTHNLGGGPGESVSFVGIVGTELSA